MATNSHNPLHPLGERGLVNRSSESLSAASIQSRFSDSFSIITNSRDSIRATHPSSRLPRATHRQFGRGPDPSRLIERPSNAATLDYYVPDGRFVQLINSDQVPRYTKDALMQVEYIILLPHPHISLQTSR
jgi:hypothetical protein